MTPLNHPNKTFVSQTPDVLQQFTLRNTNMFFLQAHFFWNE